MSRAELSQYQSRLLLVLAYVILAAVAAAGAANASTPAIRWTTVALSTVFGLIMAFLPSPEAPAWKAHLYLMVQTILGAALMYLNDDWSLFALLYFILAAHTMVLLPPRLGVSWIAGFSVITGVFAIVKWGWPGGAVTVPIYAGGYSFFAIFAHALVSADAARRESQKLLDELQGAHGKLQEYTARIEELVVVEERNRLAREMHDTLGHRLTVAAVQLEAAQRLCSCDPERSAAMVGTVREQVREALGELRSTVATLRAPIEADLQLRTSLRRLMAHFEQATGLTVHQLLPDELPPLSTAHRLALYRAAQEALTNVQRHAYASQAWLVLSTTDAAITLLVSDDGRGITHSSKETGFGLHGLRERAEQLGGELYLEPRRGGGTQLAFRLPLSKHDGSPPQLDPQERGGLHAPLPGERKNG